MLWIVASSNINGGEARTNVCAATMGKLEDWLSTVPSPDTRKSHIYGISVFEHACMSVNLVEVKSREQESIHIRFGRHLGCNSLDMDSWTNAHSHS